ncbi:MAG: hypothetical protein ACFFAO_20745 [Candidatus Hermodarchaeota archaeon]
MSDKVVRIRIDFDGDTKEMFEKLKEKYNLKSNAETLRLIIKLAYDQEFESS